MSGIPGDLYGRVQAALLRCGACDSDRALRALFVDARLSAWRDLLPEAGNRAERARAVVAALSERTNPAGENALALLLRVLAENTPPGDALREELAALAGEVTAAVRVEAVGGAQPPAGPTVFNQQGRPRGTSPSSATGTWWGTGMSSASRKARPRRRPFLPRLWISPPCAPVCSGSMRYKSKACALTISRQSSTNLRGACNAGK